VTPLTLNLNSVIKLTSEEFYQLSQDNPDLKLERHAAGEVNLILQIAQWNEQNQLGEVFDSSTGFTLPNKADRSPDVSWVEKSRWNALTKEQKEKFIPLCPDFVIEILSPSDRLPKVQEKMQEYLDNGCRLGLLINRKQQELEIYRPHQKVEILPAPQTFVAEDELPGFILNLQKIWE
jgi:Uma2 family endonuclease